MSVVTYACDVSTTEFQVSLGYIVRACQKILKRQNKANYPFYPNFFNGYLRTF